MIKQIYQYIILLISGMFLKKKQKKEEEKNQYVCQISFCLDKDKEIDIYCKLKDISDNVKVIHNDSMIIAEFLHIINSGKLQHQTLSLIQEQTEYNAEQKLLFDNIVFYLTLLDTEKNKSHKTKDTEPLIKPSKVFLK